MKKALLAFILFALSASWPFSQACADKILLDDGRIIKGKIIDKTPTKYIIENQGETGVTEIIEIEFHHVTTIIEDAPPPSETEEAGQVDLPDREDLPKGFDALDPASYKQYFLDKRNKLKEILNAEIDKHTEGKDTVNIEFIKNYSVEIFLLLIVLAFVLLLTLFKPKKRKVAKKEKNYLKNRLPGLNFIPMKDKRSFKNISVPGVFIYYQIPQISAMQYNESICKTIDTDGVSVIIDESVPMGATLKLVIVREKTIKRNLIKEHIHLNADVKSVKEGPVKDTYELYLVFHHLFLSQRAFISKILTQEKNKT